MRFRILDCTGIILQYLVLLIFSLALAISPLWAQTSFQSFSIFQEDGSKGIVDANGNEIIPARYLDLGWTQGIPKFEQGVIGYHESGRWGLLNANNKILTPPKYSVLYPASESDYIIAAIPGRFSGENFFGLINSNGKVIIPFMYAGLEVVEEVAVAKSLDGNLPKYGMINMSNQPILPFHYKSIKPVNEQLFAVSREGGKIALVDPRGKETIRYRIDSIEWLQNNYFEIYQDGKVGLIDGSGALILSPEYKKVEVEENGMLSFLSYNNWEFIDENGLTQPGIQADYLQVLGKEIFKINLNNQSWLTDAGMNAISMPYDAIDSQSDHHYLAIRNGKKGLLNRYGELVLPVEYDSVIVEYPYVFTITKKATKDEWNVYDTLGIRKNHFVYQKIIPVDGNLIPVKRNNRWGFMSRDGVEMIQCVYDKVIPFTDDRSVVDLHGEYGIIDTEGKWLTLPTEKKIEILNDSLLLVRSPSQNRVTTTSGKLVYFTENKLIPRSFYFEEIIDSTTTWHISMSGTLINTDARYGIEPVPFYDSLLIIYKAGQPGVVSDSGQEIIPFGEWDRILPPSQGFLGIKADEFYGFIDLDNKLRIANRYEGIGPFTEDLAAIKVRGKWGFINQREELVCQPLYNEVGEFKNGICIVREGKHWGLIDKEGQIVQPMEYEAIEMLPSGNFLTIKDSEYGLLDKSGRTILYPKFESIEETGNGMVIVHRRGGYGLFDLHGVNVLPTIYHSLVYVPSRDLFLTMTPGIWKTIALPENL